MGEASLAANVERFTGFAETYDDYRPTPPPELAAVLSRLAGVERPGLVVDVGCGTGLSTRIWQEVAVSVVGVDPSTDMLREARSRTKAANVDYREGYSHCLPASDASADVVTCSQSLHWMDPEATFREAARVLRAGGVFAAIDCDWPPVFYDRGAELAFDEVLRRASAFSKERRLTAGVRRWPKEEHLSRMRSSGRFGYAREILLHKQEDGTAERAAGLAISFGGVMTAMKGGATASELGIDALRAAVRRAWGDGRSPWLFCYRVRVGIV